MTTDISYKQECFRKLIHLSSFWMVALILFYRGSKYDLVIFFTILFILNILCELAFSFKVPIIYPVYNFFFGHMLRNEVKRGQLMVSGAAPVFATAALISLFFKQEYAAISLGVMLIADTAAALIGRKFGKHKLNSGKSLEGWIAFCFFGCLFALSTLASLKLLTFSSGCFSILGVFLASLAELFNKQLHIDDNLSIPLIFGLMLSVSNM